MLQKWYRGWLGLMGLVGLCSVAVAQNSTLAVEDADIFEDTQMRHFSLADRFTARAWFHGVDGYSNVFNGAKKVQINGYTIIFPDVYRPDSGVADAPLYIVKDQVVLAEIAPKLQTVYPNENVREPLPGGLSPGTVVATDKRVTIRGQEYVTTYFDIDKNTYMRYNDKTGEAGELVLEGKACQIINFLAGCCTHPEAPNKLVYTLFNESKGEVTRIPERDKQCKQYNP